MQLRSHLTAVLVALALLPAVTLAQTPEARGLEIAQAADQRDEGFGDTAAVLQMTLRNRKGDERTRQMRSRTLEMSADGDRSMIIFDDPADVKGTVLLTHSHKEGNDDQWLFLPALKRVKRISSSNKSGPFMGSEFAYEDLSSQEVEKYTYRFVRDENFDDREHFVIERFPVDKKSGYTRQTVWLDRDEYRVWKVEYYDRKGALLKTMIASGFTQYLDKFWRPVELSMQNHQTGKSTRLTFADFVFDNGFDENDFNRNSLQNAR